MSEEPGWRTKDRASWPVKGEPIAHWVVEGRATCYRGTFDTMRGRWGTAGDRDHKCIRCRAALGHIFTCDCTRCQARRAPTWEPAAVKRRRLGLAGRPIGHKIVTFVPGDFIRYVFPLRKDTTLTFLLPRDLTQAEVDQIAGWLTRLVAKRCAGG